jgi:hypothetical protein
LLLSTTLIAVEKQNQWIAGTISRGESLQVILKSEGKPEFYPSLALPRMGRARTPLLNLTSV